MTRVALLSSEPIRPLMAGIGIRYLEFARRLPAAGVDVVLVSPAAPEETAEVGGLGGVEVRRFERGRLAAILGDCDAAVAQGQLANDLVLEMPGLPVAIDLYDPWLIENFAYHQTLGLDPYRNDHATWVLQMSRGDFFLCSSEEQRTFYLGFLAALGRVNPERMAGDPDLATLIAPVPFGVPDALPPHRPVLPPRAAGERRLLFGGLYDWYDPWTLLDALAALDRPWTLLLIRNPNPESTPQRLFAAVEARCRSLGWWGSRVQVHDWVPAERRYDLLRDVDLLVAPHRPSLETRLSLRTRFLDALAAGCPVVTSEGGAMSRLLIRAPRRLDRPFRRRSGPGAHARGSPGRPHRPSGRRPRAGHRLPLGPRAGAARPLLPRALGGRDQGAFRPAPRDRGPFGPPRLPPAPQAPRLAGEARVTGGGIGKVTVAILSWNGRRHLETCLEALAAQHDPGVPWEILVLDNGSTDGTAAWMRERWGSDRRVRLIESPLNLGFCGGNNRLAAEAEGDALALLNNDTRPEPGWLGALVEATRLRPAGRGRRLRQDRGLGGEAPRLRPRPDDLRRPRLPARLPQASEDRAGAGGGGGAPLRLRRQPAGAPRLLPGGRRLRRELLRLPGGRRPRLAPLVGRGADRLRARRGRASPLQRHERPAGALQPRLPLRAQRLPDGV